MSKKNKTDELTTDNEPEPATDNAEPKPPRMTREQKLREKRAKLDAELEELKRQKDLLREADAIRTNVKSRDVYSALDWARSLVAKLEEQIKDRNDG